MLLLAVTWTAVTVYLLVSVVNCWTSCKSSRTLPLVLSQEPEDQSIWELSYEIFIGYRFDDGSCSKQLFKYKYSTCASMAWLYSTSRNTASRCHLSSATTVDPRLWSTDCSTNQDELYGDRSFAVQGPRPWNSLHVERRAPDISLETFRHKLKTFLFTVWLST